MRSTTPPPPLGHPSLVLDERSLLGKQLSPCRLFQATLLLLSLLTIAPRVAAEVYVVDPSGGGDFTRIQDAIESSHHGDTIEVLPGVYRESLFYGGRRILVRGVEGPGTTILEGEGAHNLATFLFGEPREAVLEGFTLRNGRGRPITAPAPGAPVSDLEPHSPASIPFRPIDLTTHPLGAADSRVALLEESQRMGGTFGGAIVCMSASPTLRNLVFEDNLANVGGALAALYAAPLVVDCQFRGNVSGAGGALAGSFDGLDVRGCAFSGNSSVFGGAFHGEDSRAEFETSSFNDNVAAYGGSWYLLGTGNPGLVSARHSQFGSNFASDVSGITARFHDLSVRQSVFWAMWPDFHVLPAVLVESADAAVDHCVFQGRNESSTLQCAGGARVDAGCNLFYPGALPLACSSDPTNVVADPQFCDAPNGDFHVRVGSPCLPPGSPPGCGPIGIHDTPGCSEPLARPDPSTEPETRATRSRAGDGFPGR